MEYEDHDGVVAIKREDALGKIRIVVEVDVNKAMQLMLPALIEKVGEQGKPRADRRKRRRRPSTMSPTPFEIPAKMEAAEKEKSTPAPTQAAVK